MAIVGQNALEHGRPLMLRLRAAFGRVVGMRTLGCASLRLIETMHVGPKRQVLLLECDGQRFLITAGADGMSAPVALASHPRTDGDS